MGDEKTLEEQLYRAGWISLVTGFLLTVFYLYVLVPRFSYPCVFLTLFGFYCPGCGGTRALDALLHGRFLLSLWYHPFVMYGAVLFLGFMATHTLERLKIGEIKGWKFHEWYLYGAVAVIIGNWIIKNILLYFFQIHL